MTPPDRVIMESQDATADRQTIYSHNENPDRSEIQKFYTGSNIFITGATGFVGKTLMEKLLRSCPDLDTLYVLVRPKKGKDAHTRIEEVFDDPVFSVLKREFPKFRHKVCALLGDCASEMLGLSARDREILVQKVHVIFHAAATVKFDEQLRTALEVNVQAPLHILTIAKQMKNLQALVHVSTAYSHCYLDHVDEKLYGCPVDLDSVNQMISSLDDEEIDRLLPKILGRWPNTYTFTKALAEQEIDRNCEDLPVAIFRPAIVTSSAKEPMPGWVDNMYGPTGAVAGGATGMLRTMHCDTSVTAEIVPVDLVVNCLIATAQNTAAAKRKKDTPPLVYNYVSSVENRITWGDYMSLICRYSFDYPLVSAVWYRSLTLHKSATAHTICKFLLHILPALLLDGIAVCCGQPPKLLKVYRKIHKFSAVLSHFTTHEIVFRNDNVTALWRRSSPEDRLLFPFSISELDWSEYFTLYLRGIRTYLFKETDDTLKTARIKWNRLYYLHQLVKVLLLSLICYVCWTLFDTLSRGIFN